MKEDQAAAGGGGIEREVHGLELMRVFGLMAPHGAVGGPCPLLLSGSGPLKALLPPDPLHPFVIHAPALAPQQRYGPSAGPSGCARLAISRSRCRSLVSSSSGPCRHGVGCCGVAHNPAGEPLRCPVTLLQDNHRPAPAFRAQKFPSARSFSMAFSSSASARSFLSRAFSSPAASAVGFLGLHAPVLLTPAVDSSAASPRSRGRPP